MPHVQANLMVEIEKQYRKGQRLVFKPKREANMKIMYHNSNPKKFLTLATDHESLVWAPESEEYEQLWGKTEFSDGSFIFINGATDRPLECTADRFGILGSATDLKEENFFRVESKGKLRFIVNK